MRNESSSKTSERLWPTPTEHGNHNRAGASKNSGDGLATAVKKKLWPTPNASDGLGTRQASPEAYLKRKVQIGLPNAVKMLQASYPGQGDPNDPKRGKKLQTVARESIPTSGNSTEPNSGESICLQQGFPASLQVVPGSEEARRMTAGSGRRLFEFYVKRLPLAPCLKTLLESCLLSPVWNSSICFLRWKVTATPFNRLLFRLVPSMPDTDETECGLWPTVHGMSPDGKTNGPSGNELGRAVNQRLWPTPKGAEAGPDFAKLDRSATGISLQTAVMLPTPDANCFNGGAENQRKSQLNGSLNPAFVSWLMGYPLDWLDLPDGPTKTRKSRARPKASKTGLQNCDASGTASSRKSPTKS